MPQISPTVAFYWTLVMAMVGLAATGNVPFPDSVPSAVQHEVTQWATFFVGYWAVVAPLLHGLSSSAPGPLVSDKAQAK